MSLEEKRAAIPCSATFDDVEHILGPALEEQPTAEDLVAWERFGSGATDLQRVNVFLQDGKGGAVFWNAADVLGGLPDPAPLPISQAIVQVMVNAIRAFVAAAETCVPHHRTRLHLVRPGDDSAYQNGVILEWKRADRPAFEELDMGSVASGALVATEVPDRRDAARTMAEQAAMLYYLVIGLPRGLHVTIIVRTFDP